MLVSNHRTVMPTTTIQYFAYAHLPPKLQTVSKPMGDVALALEKMLPDGPEKSAGMRKLLEAKDCFVRSALDMPEQPTDGLPPHQKRVVDEQAELDVRLSKLDAFILENPKFLELPEAERGRLQEQSKAMALYLSILVKRISAF